MEQQPIQLKENTEGEINLRQLFEQYAYYWKWFVLAIILSLGVAIVYLRYAQKKLQYYCQNIIKR